MKRIIDWKGQAPRVLSTLDLPGIGGHIKERPSDFCVEEIPLFPCSGEGDHVYIDLERSGQNTRDVARDLASIFRLQSDQVGTAGLKDAQASSRQRFSLFLPGVGRDKIESQIESSRPAWTIHGIDRHSHKLRTGQLTGNRFEIKLRPPFAAEDERELIERLDRKLKRLQEGGVPNFYGEQRYGRDGTNHWNGWRIFKGKDRRRIGHSQRRLLLSAMQSFLFDHWLARRIHDGLLHSALTGDVMRVVSSGGLFLCEDVEQDNDRYQKHELELTGPIFGHDEVLAGEKAGQREMEILADANLPHPAERPDVWKRARLPGARRSALLRPTISCEWESAGLFLSFELPAGAYATVILREIVEP